MSPEVISRFEGRNYNLCIELTEKQKCVVIGSDCTCRQGYIRHRQGEKIIAAFHCRVYIEKDGRDWKTYIQEKAMNSQMYETYVNGNRLKMREIQWLCNKDEIKIGSGGTLLYFAFHDEYSRREEERNIEVPKELSNRFKNYNEVLNSSGAHSV